MIATDTTYRGLMDAILREPEADVHRLVMADWLDDQGDAPRRCQRCLGHGVISIDQNPCPDCDGKGKTPGPNAARAEFIRVQVELAARGLVGAWGDGSALRRRERDILFDHWPRWLHDTFDGLAHDVGCSARDDNDFGISLYSAAAGELGHFDCSFRRGFPAVITCRAADWWGEPGHPGHGPAIVRVAPIETVEISDREPWFNGGGVCWFDAAREGPSTVPSHANVPHPLFTLLAGYNTSPSSKRWRPYPSEQAARAALSTAALAWARLPECGECRGEGQATIRTIGGRRIGVSGLGPVLCRLCHGLGRAERLDRIAPQG